MFIANNLHYAHYAHAGVRTCEVDIADILEQHCAVDGIHLGAEADFSRTQVFVHVM